MNIAFISILVLSLISIAYNGYHFTSCCSGNTNVIERAKNRIIFSFYVAMAMVLALIYYNFYF